MATELSPMRSLCYNHSNTLRLVMLCLSAVLLSSGLSANNLRIKNLTLKDSLHLECTISWEHSWNLEGKKTPYNYDAVWLFFKYRETAGTQWMHASLSSLSSDHQVIAGPDNKVRLEGVADQAGLWVKRQQRGAGPVPETRIRIRLAKGLSEKPYQFRAYGIEMVKVKRDTFYLGDGKSNNTLQTASTGKPYRVDHSGSIPVDSQGNKLTSTGDSKPAADIPESYPVGYEGFYAMKYEISQSQYVGFLNALTKAQQARHIENDPGSAKGSLAFPGGRGNRNGIVIQKPAEGTKPARFACDANPQSPVGARDDGQNRACNFLKWSDVAAYLDWAALAPLTETAFEKLCRGPAYPVKLGFAWGTAKVTDANAIVNDGTPLETVEEPLPAGHGLASHGYAGPKGPLRSGFGGSDSSTRLSIGAGYYGALELSGNLWELVVTLNKEGLAYNGHPGDGRLSQKGFADESLWPGRQGKGAGFKGGAWNSGILQEFRDLAVSDRFYIYDQPNSRRGTTGGRGGRFP